MGPFEQIPPPQQNKSSSLGGILGVGGSILGAGISYLQQNKANKFNVDMYNRQNEYNSPSEQMHRLQKAGLNPNLIYGTGNSNTGNASQAPQFESLAESGYRPVDIPSNLQSLQAFTDWDIKKATADNLRARTESEKQNLLLKTAETSAKILGNEKLTTERPQWQALSEGSLQALQAGNKQIEANTKYTLNQDERAALQNVYSTREAAERILTMRLGREQTSIAMEGQKFDNVVKALDAQIASEGVRPGDALWYRLIDKFTSQLMEGKESSSYEKGSSFRNSIRDWKNKMLYKSKYPNLYPKR